MCIVCVCVYVCVCIYSCMCVYTCLDAYVYACMCACTCAHPCTCICACMYMYLLDACKHILHTHNPLSPWKQAASAGLLCWKRVAVRWQDATDSDVKDGRPLTMLHRLSAILLPSGLWLMSNIFSSCREQPQHNLSKENSVTQYKTKETWLSPVRTQHRNKLTTPPPPPPNTHTKIGDLVLCQAANKQAHEQCNPVQHLVQWVFF